MEAWLRTAPAATPLPVLEEGRAAAAANRAQAVAFRALAENPLSRIPKERSMLSSKMEELSAATKKRVNISRSMTDNPTKARKAILDAGLTPQDIADTLGVGRSTVNAWCNGTRSIPQRYAERLLKRHHIPLDAWKNRA